VTDVLVEENTPVKKGQPLFQFDRRPYEHKVAQLEAQLAEAKQNVLVLQSNVAAATQTATRAKVELDYQQYQKTIFDKLAKEQAVREEDVVQRATSVASAQATQDGALAELEVARLKYKSEIGGVNTTVANVEAQLRQAQYYLDNTTLVAPEDGRIINLQVRPGMVSGIYRIGGIAALIAEADRYLLATFYQETSSTCGRDNRWRLRSIFIQVRSSPGRSTASGAAMELVSTFQATKFQNFISRPPMSRRASTL
jgi:multidrug resistance efflux pump